MNVENDIRITLSSGQTVLYPESHPAYDLAKEVEIWQTVAKSEKFAAQFYRESRDENFDAYEKLLRALAPFVDKETVAKIRIIGTRGQKRHPETRDMFANLADTLTAIREGAL